MIGNIFNIAGSALHAQMSRMNLAASNLANIDSVSTTEEGAYKAKRIVFKTIVEGMEVKNKFNENNQSAGGVKIESLVIDKKPVRKQYEPNNPIADKDGFVYQSNVSEIGEMVDMMAAARSYQNNIETVNTAKQLMMRAIDVLRS